MAILVAVSHEVLEGNNDALMSPEVQCRFKQKVTPLVTNKTLILCEGLNHDELIGPKHPKYDFTRSFFFNDTLGSTQPTIGGFDPRATTSPEVANTIASVYDEWYTIVTTSVRMERNLPVPATLLAIIKSLRLTRPHAQIARRLTLQELRVAHWIDDTSRNFDRRYLNAMKSYGPSYDKCLFVGGATHVISLALKSNHSVVDLTPQEDARGIFFSYLSDGWARLFIEADLKK